MVDNRKSGSTSTHTLCGIDILHFTHTLSLERPMHCNRSDISYLQFHTSTLQTDQVIDAIAASVILGTLGSYCSSHYFTFAFIFYSFFSLDSIYSISDFM